LHQQFQHFSDECQLPIAHSVKQSVQKANGCSNIHDRSLLQYDKIALISMNCCSEHSLS